MDIIGLLERDHRKVQDILSSLQATFRNDEYARQTLLEQLMIEVLQCCDIKETILYPPLREFEDTQAGVVRGVKEHALLWQLLKELHDLDNANDEWSEKFDLLQQRLMLHINEEEQVILKQARTLLPASRLVAMASTIEKYATA